MRAYNNKYTGRVFEEWDKARKELEAMEFELDKTIKHTRFEKLNENKDIDNLNNNVIKAMQKELITRTAVKIKTKELNYLINITINNCIIEKGLSGKKAYKNTLKIIENYLNEKLKNVFNKNELINLYYSVEKRSLSIVIFDTETGFNSTNYNYNSFTTLFFVTYDNELRTINNLESELKPLTTAQATALAKKIIKKEKMLNETIKKAQKEAKSLNDSLTNGLTIDYGLQNNEFKFMD